MGKSRVEKPFNGGKWSEARFNSFIKAALRQATMRWGPIQEAKKQARVARGEYLCAGCNLVVPASRKNDKGKRVSNISVDHIEPVIDPHVGFESWDTSIKRMFPEIEGFQVLCYECHKKKTDAEKAIAAERRKNERRKSSR